MRCSFNGMTAPYAEGSQVVSLQGRPHLSNLVDQQKVLPFRECSICLNIAVFLTHERHCLEKCSPHDFMVQHSNFVCTFEGQWKRTASKQKWGLLNRIVYKLVLIPWGFWSKKSSFPFCLQAVFIPGSVHFIRLAL